MVTKQDVTKAAGELGIQTGDVVLIHSSFKSLGEVEQGAHTIVTGFMEAVGTEGTLVFPTLCQRDWEHVYENWHLDRDSDVGYLTNYFRKLPEARRSDQATHSVAAAGKHAQYLTQTHGGSGLRYGIYGDTPFAADSPWEKMYKLNAKIVFLGVSVRKCTFRHYAEYCFMDKCLRRVEGRPEYQELKAQVWCYERFQESGVWPALDNEYIRSRLDQKHKVSYAKCGAADLICFSAGDFVELAAALLEKREWDAFQDPGRNKPWLDEVDRVSAASRPGM